MAVRRKWSCWPVGGVLLGRQRAANCRAALKIIETLVSSLACTRGQSLEVMDYLLDLLPVCGVITFAWMMRFVFSHYRTTKAITVGPSTINSGAHCENGTRLLCGPTAKKERKEKEKERAFVSSPFSCRILILWSCRAPKDDDGGGGAFPSVS